MKAIVLTADGVEDTELLVPYYRLREAGLEVDVAAPKAGTVQGKHGYSIEANLSFDQVNPAGYDLLLLPGGKAPETVRLQEKALEVTRRMMQADRTVAAICHGFQILISAGLAQGRRATCWWGVKDDLIAAGAHWHDEAVVIDGNLITSRSPDDLPAFCRAMMAAVEAHQHA